MAVQGRWPEPPPQPADAARPSSGRGAFQNRRTQSIQVGRAELLKLITLENDARINDSRISLLADHGNRQQLGRNSAQALLEQPDS